MLLGWLTSLCVCFAVSSASYDDDSFDDADAADVPYRVDPLQHLYPLTDPLREDDHEDFELADLIALSRVMVDHSIDVYSPEEKQQLLDFHHAYRGNTTGKLPSAANMMWFEYDNVMEWSAHEYIRVCVFEHGLVPNDNMTGKQSQSLYNGPARIVSRPLWLFYIEYRDYFFNNDTCRLPNSKYMCGHMAAEMWHNETHLGMARRSYCWPKTPEKIFMAIHYMPKGGTFFTGVHMYEYGWPCRRCWSGVNLCHNNLCVTERQCKVYNLDCECRLTCHNCAKPDWKKCRCQPCKFGWDDYDCAKVCTDLYNYGRPGACERFSLGYCRREVMIDTACRRRCLSCMRVEQSTDADQLCCGGKLCDPYYELDEETCECKLVCPSYKCLYPPSTTTTTTTTTTPTITTTTTAMTTKSPRRTSNEDVVNDIYKIAIHPKPSLASLKSFTNWLLLNSFIISFYSIS